MKALLEQVRIFNAAFFHPLMNFDIQKYYQNESKLNGVYSRNNLPKIKDGAYVINRAYVINLDEYKSIETHWIALFVNNRFGVEHISKEI